MSSPFDPKENGACPTEPPRVKSWLHYFVAAMLILMALILLLGNWWPIDHYIWIF
jgi:hypothetical protein